MPAAARTVSLLFAVFALAVLLIAGAAPAQANNGGVAKTRVAGDYCARATSNYGGCCCAARDKLPVTKTKTVTAKLRYRQARSKEQEPAVDSAFVEAIEQDELPFELSKRNLCPRCPVGSQPLSVAAAKAKGIPESKAAVCCPARKVVTKTVTKGRKATMAGRLWIDVDKNNKYNNPPDKPIANTLIVFYAVSNKKRETEQKIGSGITNSVGQFSDLIDPLAPGTQVNVYKTSDINHTVLLTVYADANGGANAPIPIPVPPKPTVNPVQLVGNIGTVTGNGTAGRTVTLYVDNKPVATGTCGPDGSFSIATPKKLKSGTYAFSVTMQTPQGINSDPVSAGSDSILPPPTITFGAYKECSKASVNGTAEPNANVEIFVKGISIGTCVADGSGKFSLPLSSAISSADYYPLVLTATQANAKGTSDLSAPYPVSIAAPVVTSTGIAPSSQKITAQGTGEPGSTITVYANGTTSLGTAVVVGADGTWTFTTTTDQSPGLYQISVKQTFIPGPDQTAAGNPVTIPDALPTTTKSQTRTATATPTTTLVPHIIQMVALEETTCVTWNNGMARCWGPNWSFSPYTSQSYPWGSVSTDVAYSFGMEGSGIFMFKNGTMISTNNPVYYNETQTPADVTPSNIRLIAACENAFVTVLQNGSLVGWGGYVKEVFLPPGKRERRLKKRTSILVPQNETKFPANLNGNDVKELMCGGYNPLAILNNGSVVVWGSNEYAQVSGMPSDLGPVTTACAGEFFYCAALQGNGSVVCWGKSDDNQLNVPAGLGTVKQLSCGDGFALALLANNSVVGWGNPWGDPSLPNAAATVPPLISSGLDVKQVMAYDVSGAILLANDTILLWGGDNNDNQTRSIPPEYGYVVPYPVN